MAERVLEVDVGDARIAAAVGGAYAALGPLLPAALHLGCPLRAATGVPCPLCGLTTAVGRALRLDPTGALAANPLGVVLAVLAIVLLVRPPRRLALPVSAAVGLVAASWGFELVRVGVLM